MFKAKIAKRKPVLKPASVQLEKIISNYDAAKGIVFFFRAALSAKTKKRVLEFLKENKSTLIHLELGGCKITDEDFAEEFGRTLIGLPKLRFLGLSHNKFTSASISILQQIILSSPQLKKLDLQYNDLNSEFIQSFLSSTNIREHINQIDIDLSSNNIDELALPILEKWCSKNTQAIAFVCNNLNKRKLESACDKAPKNTKR
jgi:hypothetical protein